MSARERILEYMRNQAYRPMTSKELLGKFGIDRDQYKFMKKLLQELVTVGLVYRDNNGCYGLPEKMGLIAGRLDGNQKGFAFLMPDDPTLEDVFISRENMNGAMHNDKVFIRLLPHLSGKRKEGEVIKILERVNHQIVGNLDQGKNFGFVIPDNKRIFYDIFIPREELKGATQDQKVVAAITRWPNKKRNPEGKIVEILGDKEEPGVDIEAIIRQLDLPREFPEDVLAEVDRLSFEITEEEIAHRQDLRQLPMVTIDGEDAKDLDDAVSIEQLTEGQVRLGVHIADVSHYVKEGSSLDQEALERGTSIYLIDRVIPMLPRQLSNGICSLNPREDRLALSVFITYDLETLEIVNHEITPSVIKTNYRLTYQEVRRILEDNDQSLIDRYSDFVPRLRLMNQLRQKLRGDRFKQGSIDFDFPEVKVILDDEGRPVELVKRKHGTAEQLIEEFMIAANRMVTRDMFWREIPFIFRVHDQPELDRLQEFNQFIKNFGYYLKGLNNGVHPRELQDLLDAVEDKPEERVINSMLLRSMKKAIYSPQNIGHFGLALEYYTHFTSPIRRYPDLMIHRIIKEVLSKGSLSEKRTDQLESRLYHITEHCSLQERRAMEAERDSVDLKKIEFMKDKVGEEYTGIISGITNFGFFVELENTVEGLVHVESLKDDYYRYNQEQQSLVGERLKRVFKFGDQVKVRVDRVNLQERQLDFVVVEE